MLADLWATFQKGGYVMYPILICSIFSVALAAERIMYYSHCDTEDSFLAKLEALLRLPEKEAAEQVRQAEGDCARLTEYYLTHKEAGIAGVETRANMMLDSYSDHLVFLNMIVTVSPLLGLLGTIIGMINSFKVFDLRAGQPFAITAGIGEALIATAFGLIVAIIALALYGFLKYRSTVLAKKITKCCAALELHENGGEAR